MVFGLATFFFVPDSPKTIKFLTEKERQTYCRDLAYDWSGDADTLGTYQEEFSWSEVASVFTDAPHVLMLFLPLFFNGATVRGRGARRYISLTNIDELFVRSMVSPTCIYSLCPLQFRSPTHLPRSTPTIVNALGHSANYTQLLTVRSFQPPKI